MILYRQSEATRKSFDNLFLVFLSLSPVITHSGETFVLSPPSRAAPVAAIVDAAVFAVAAVAAAFVLLLMLLLLLLFLLLLLSLLLLWGLP